MSLELFRLDIDTNNVWSRRRCVAATAAVTEDSPLLCGGDVWYIPWHVPQEACAGSLVPI